MDLKPQNLLLSSKENPTLKIAGRVFTFEMKDKVVACMLTPKLTLFNSIHTGRKSHP
jgi:hypothetical protein